MTMINTNVGALLARTYATNASDRMQKSMERLSSGLRITAPLMMPRVLQLAIKC